MINLTLKDFYGEIFENPVKWKCFYYMEKFIYFGVRKHNKWREARGKNWDSWEELASAIKKNGIQKPITVRPVTTPDGTKYAVVNGNHRIVAGHMAGLKEFPCEVI